MNRRSSLVLGALAGSGVLSAAPYLPDAPTVRQYFGESLPADHNGRIRFERGFDLFARNWSASADGIHNAPSCVTCHSVPTPGGSGMSQRALVAIDINKAPGSRYEVIQRPSPDVSHDALVRRTPPLFGIGLLERVMPGPNNDSFKVGVYARENNLERFVSRAFATELGVSTPIDCARKSIGAPYPSHCKAVLSEEQLTDVMVFLRLLAPPARPSRQSSEGRRLFASAGCSGCHVEVLTTSPRNRRDQPLKIYPFSDLRLHDIGTSAKGPVRTAALWGLNSFGPPYLSTGQATSIEQSIRMHRGEAEQSTAAYGNLKPSERQRLLDYLRSF